MANKKDSWQDRSRKLLHKIAEFEYGMLTEDELGDALRDARLTASESQAIVIVCAKRHRVSGTPKIISSEVGS